MANFENDIKKVVALSTLSQLGMMFISIGLGHRTIAFFHLVAHALFKSTLFMCTGFVIHNIHGRQDIRLRGVVNYGSPVLRVVFSCTNISLCGFPFLSGFYSKDIILELFFSNFFGFFILLVGIFSVGLTVSYSFRFLYNNCNNKRKICSLILRYDSNFIVFFSFLTLYLFSIVGGYLFSWLIIIKGAVFFLSLIEKFYIFRVCFFILTFFIYLSFNRWIFIKKINVFYTLIGFLPQLRSHFLNKLSFYFGYSNLKFIDKGWLEITGPTGVGLFLFEVRYKIQKSQLIFLIRFFVVSVIVFIFFTLSFYLESSVEFFVEVEKVFLTLNNKTRSSNWSFFDPKSNVISTFV